MSSARQPGAPSPGDITGLVLAGGRGSRMGGVDKGLVPWRGRALVDHVIDRLRPQVGSVMVSANRNQDAYRERGVQVLGDASAGFEGPLAGILSGLRAAATPWVAVVPCDAPRLPVDLVARLAAALQGTQAAVVQRPQGDGGLRIEPVCCLLNRALADDLEEALARGERRVEPWLARHGRTAIFDRADDAGAFANLNTPDDLQA